MQRFIITTWYELAFLQDKVVVQQLIDFSDDLVNSFLWTVIYGVELIFILLHE